MDFFNIHKPSFALAQDQTDAPTETDANTQTMPLPSSDLVAEQQMVGVDKKVSDGAYKNEYMNEGVFASEVGPLVTDSQTDEDVESDTISVYTVHPGDSFKKIAELFDVSENTIRWANNLKKSDVPHVGQTLVILPISGVSYVVRKGDTLLSIAKKFGADVEDVGRFNGLEKDSELAFGETIIIPDGEVSEPAAPAKKKTTVSKLVAGATKLIKGWSGKDLGNYFLRPIAGGIRTQGAHGKNGTDISAKLGTSVYAAADGTAIVATTVGYNGGYGKYIILSHPNGTQTVYGHLSAVLIQPGQQVTRGQLIGRVGSTGRSTGPHLHWEVRGAVNPIAVNPSYGL